MASWQAHERRHTRRIGKLAGIVSIAVLALTLASVATARAQAPAVTISNPTEGSSLSTPEPAFEGETDDTSDSVTLDIHEGTNVSGALVQSLTATPSLGSWTVSPIAELPDGTYTALASQEESLTQEIGTSSPVTFTIDTVAPAVSLNSIASPSNDSTPSFSGQAGDAPGDIESVQLRVYSGTEASGSPIRTLTVTPNGASWSSGPLATLADGTYTAQAQQSDEAGNVAVSAARTFTVDTTPPSVSISAPVDGAFANSHSVTVEGAAGTAQGDAGTVTLGVYAGTKVGAQEPEKTVTATVAAGHWSTKLEGLAEGQHTLLAEQSDEAGNEGFSQEVSFTVDTVAPAVTLDAIASPTADSTPSFSGKAGTASGDVAQVKLEIYTGTTATGTPLRTITTTPSGATWSAGPITTLPDGTYTAQAQQSDQAGNTGKSTGQTFTVDTTAPSVSISTPADGTFAKSHSVTVEGTAGTADGDSSTVTLMVYAGSEVGAQAPEKTIAATVTGGHWSTSVEGLAEGQHTLLAEQSDEAGNEGFSQETTVTVDTVDPAVTLSAIASPTADSTPSFSGKAGTASGDVAQVKLEIYTGTTATGTPLRTITATPSGATWSAGPITTLPDGTYTAQAQQSDQAGNTGLSTARSFRIDTTPPVVSISSPLDSGYANSHTVSVEGSAGSAEGDSTSVTLAVYAGAEIGAQTPEKTVTATVTSGHWSAKVEGLADGAYTLLAEQSDDAGNEGDSQEVTFTVDTVAPAISLNSPSTPSTNTTPSFSGKAGTASGDVAQVKLEIYTGTTATGTPLRTITATPSGSSWSTGAVATLPDGTYTAQAQQEDLAGNIGKSTAQAFRIDTTPPSVSISSPPNGSTTRDSSPTVEGNAGTAEGDLHGITIELFSGSEIGIQSPEETIVVQATSGHWSAGLGDLSDGPHTVRASQSDSLGNIGQSSAVTFTIDTVAPAVTLSTVATPTAQTNPSFSGKAGVESGDIALVKVKLYAGSTVSGSPIQTLEPHPSGSNWTSAPTATLSDGTYTVQAEQSDQAGNVGKTAPQKFVVKSKGPKVTLTPLAEYIDTATPTLTGNAGIAEGDIKKVTVDIYSGTSVESADLLSSSEVTPVGATWSFTAVTGLPDGTYTAQAEQSDELHDLIRTTPSTFTVDTVAPTVSMANLPATTTSATPTFSGTAGTAAGDAPTVTVKLYAGSSASGEPVQSMHATVSAGAWSVAPAGALGAGLYTAQAEQSDRAGNVGRSAPQTFEVTSPPTPPSTTGTTTPTPVPDSPPSASFTWLPQTPKVGESVAFVSNSTDASSPISSFAWSVGGAAFQPGGPVLSTSFASAGNHTVRLRVTAADGLSSTFSQTISVVAAKLALMQPFPVVRIAGSDNSKGARIRLLTVQAPAGAKINIKCRGRGCPSRSESRVASSSGVGATTVTFRRFERLLRAGIVLEIRVYKTGQIGKYTRFQIRRNKLPERLDTCLSPTGSSPTKCPSS